MARLLIAVIPLLLFSTPILASDPKTILATCAETQSHIEMSDCIKKLSANSDSAPYNRHCCKNIAATFREAGQTKASPCGKSQRQNEGVKITRCSNPSRLLKRGCF